jgi:hypothetical protein
LSNGTIHHFWNSSRPPDPPIFVAYVAVEVVMLMQEDGVKNTGGGMGVRVECAVSSVFAYQVKPTTYAVTIYVQSEACHMMVASDRWPVLKQQQ